MKEDKGKEIELINRNAVMSGELIRASWYLSLDEMVVLLMVLGKLDQSKEIDFKKEFEIDVEEFAKIRNVTKRYGFMALKKAVSTLFERKITFKELDTKGKERITETRWWTSTSYSTEECRLYLTLNPKIVEYLFELKKNYGTLRLREHCAMKSIHSSRLLSLLDLKRYRGKSDYILEYLPDLISNFGLEGKYTSYGAFKKVVLMPAIKELNERAIVKIDLKELKLGRKVDRLRFNYTFY